MPGRPPALPPMMAEPSDGGPGPAPRPLGKAVRGGLRLSLISQTVTQLGSIVATVILARVLTPGEFGLVAITQSVLGVTALVSLAGINAALVTRRDGVDRAASTFFLLAAALAVVSIGGAVLLATPLTAALGQREAGPYLATLSASFAADLLALVPLGLLQRYMRFGWLNGAQAAGAGVYFTGEIALALLGNGAWSVILAQVAGSVVTLVLAMVGARWVPRHRPDLGAVRGDIRLTAGLGFAQLLSYLQKNVDYWSVSRALGSSVLGVYYIAYVVPNILRLRVSTAMRQVLLPAFASAPDRTSAAALWRQSLPLVFGVGVPALVGLAAVAPEVVAVFFGRRWGGAAAPLRVLTIATTLDLVMTSVAALATAQRLVRPYVLVLAVRAVATAVLSVAAVAVFGNATAVAWAVSVAAVIAFALQEVILSPPLQVPIASVWRPVAGYLALSALMGAAVLVTGRLLTEVGAQPWLTLLVAVLLGAGLYIGVGVRWAPSLLHPVVTEVRRVVLGR